MTVYTPKVPYINLRELEARPQTIVGFRREYPSGHLVELHHHERAQLIYASEGIMRVDTPEGIWVVPPMRAIWVPPKVDHEIRASSPVQLRTLFFRPSLRHSLPNACCVIEVAPLLRELILRAVELGANDASPGPSSVMTQLILDEIRLVKSLPMHIPIPTDARAMRVCQRLLQNPANAMTCAEWGESVGASTRTLERVFRRETGMTFRVWRQQVRLLAALNRLAARTPISVVAADLGYNSASAFTAMFRRTLGRPPKDFFEPDPILS